MEIHLSLLMIIILFVCSLVTLIENEILEDKDFTRTIMGIIIGCSMIAMFLMIAYLCKPRAIDVYRDKTPTPPTPTTTHTTATHPTTPTHPTTATATHPTTATTTHSTATHPTPTTTTHTTATHPPTLEITYFEFN